MKTFWTILAVSVALLLLSLPIGAQTSTTGVVQGTVTDPQGAAVPGAEAKLLDQATNQSRTETTNESGLYVFVNVPPGIYSVTIVKAGFRTSQVPTLRVEV